MYIVHSHIGTQLWNDLISGRQTYRILRQPGIRDNTLLLIISIRQAIIQFIVRVTQRDCIRDIMSRLKEIFQLITSGHKRDCNPVSVIIQRRVKLSNKLPVHCGAPVGYVLIVHTTSGTVNISVFSFQPLAETVLKFRKPKGSLKRNGRAICHSKSFLPFPAFGGNQNHSVSGTCTVKSRSVRTFQNRNTLNIFLIYLSGSVSVVYFSFT